MTNLNVNVSEEKTKGELMGIKRKITEAGRIMERIADDVEQLAALKKEIKLFEESMVASAGATVVLVSGEYIAELGAEKKARAVGYKQNLALFGELGLQKFMEVCTFPIPAMKKAAGDHFFDEVCPESYSGKGRVFSLKPKS